MPYIGKDQKVDQRDVELMKNLFIARFDAFLKQQIQSNGASSYIKADRPLTDTDIQDHLLGKYTYGVYVISKESKCKFSGFDIDIPKNINIDETSWKDAKNKVCDLLITLIENGVKFNQILIEHSGRRGFHVLVLFEEAIPSWQAYSFAKLILDKSGVVCEFFPKQYFIGDNGFGNGIKLPAGIHMATGQRSHFVDEEFNPFQDQFEYLRKVERLPISFIQDILSKNGIPLEPETKVLEVSEDMDFDLTKKGGSVDSLIKKCKCLEDLIKRAKSINHLTNDERLLIANIFIQLGADGEKKIHEIISLCTDYSKEHTQSALTYIKEKGYKPTTCQCLKERGICQYSCRLKARSGINPSPIQLCFPNNIASEMFEVGESAADFISLKGEEPLTFNISGFSEYKNGIWARLEVFEQKNLIYNDNITLSSEKRRTQCINKIIEMLEAKSIDRKALERYLLEIERILRIRISERKNKEDEEERIPEMTEEEKEEALVFLKNPNMLDEVEKDLRLSGLVGESANGRMLYLIGTSRLLDQPLACVVKAVSSAGKNLTVGCVLNLMPPESKHIISRATPHAFEYIVKNGLKHKVIHIAERAGAEEADYPIRSLLSEGELAVLIPVKNPHTGMMETKKHIVEGPAAYIETTTQPHINEQNETRLLTLTIDESEDQTKAVHEEQRRQKTLEGLLTRENLKNIIRKHHNAQRLLRRVKVVIPYAEDIEFPSNKVRTRRDQLKFLSTIEVIALVRQFQKEIKIKDGIEYIEADLIDYALAYELITVVLGQTLDEVNQNSRCLLASIINMINSWMPDPNKICDLADKDEGKVATNIIFTRGDVRRYVKELNDSAVYLRIKELERYELLRVFQGGQGRVYKYTLSPEEIESNQPSHNLLNPEQLKAKLELKTSLKPLEKS